jgi:hypothetical protein
MLVQGCFRLFRGKTWLDTTPKKAKKAGPNPGSNRGSLAPKASILPLDHWAIRDRGLYCFHPSKLQAGEIMEDAAALEESGRAEKGVLRVWRHASKLTRPLIRGARYDE